MDILLAIGLLLLVGYTAGWMLEKIGLPKIIGYIAVGIFFSPNTINFLDHNIIQKTFPLMEICLAFIAFEVGGQLKWEKIKKHEKEIISITLMASFLPFVLISMGIYILGILVPTILPFDSLTLLLLSLVLGALASPTAPAATLAVIHQYKARGKVTDTIMGVVALDDVLGILLFSLTIAFVSIFSENDVGLLENSLLNSVFKIIVAILVGFILGFIIDPITVFFGVKTEGQWVVFIFSLIILCAGLSKVLQVDEILSAMSMGAVVVNISKEKRIIFKILERYTEDLIFLFFFILSGLHLDISTIPEALAPILVFVLLRIVGKIYGAYLGARIAKTNHKVQKYTAGGLLPQAGVVIGLVLSIYQKEQYKDISEMLLTIIMGTTIVYELLGPYAAKYSLRKAGEIK